MDEAQKTNRLRGDEFKRQFFSEDVIDIGCGPDLVVPHAVPFDLEHGDAQHILDFFKPESFGCVHSSHCLEHMRDVEAALSQWWALVRPGGHMVIVVPDEDLYEQGVWPSMFNGDHKATFSLGKKVSWSPVSHDLGALVSRLPDVEIIEASVQDGGYNRRLMRTKVSKLGRALFDFGGARERFLQKLMRRGLPVYRLSLAVDWVERALGKPVDQTTGLAVAQIQVIARKRLGSSTN